MNKTDNLPPSGSPAPFVHAPRSFPFGRLPAHRHHSTKRNISTIRRLHQTFTEWWCYGFVSFRTNLPKLRHPVHGQTSAVSRAVLRAVQALARRPCPAVSTHALSRLMVAVAHRPALCAVRMRSVVGTSLVEPRLTAVIVAVSKQCRPTRMMMTATTIAEREEKVRLSMVCCFAGRRGQGDGIDVEDTGGVGGGGGRCWEPRAPRYRTEEGVAEARRVRCSCFVVFPRGVRLFLETHTTSGMFH